MLTLEERTELLSAAAELHRASAFHDLVELLSPLSDDQLVGDPDLGYWLSLAYYRTDQYAAARNLNETLLARSHGASSERLYRKYLVLRGVLRVEQGDLIAARAAFDDAIARATPSRDHWVISDVMMNLGILAWIDCTWGEALACFQRALTSHIRLGRRYATAACHQNMAMTYREMNRRVAAESHFETAHQLYANSTPDRNNELSLVESERALMLSQVGDHYQAEAMARRALERVEHSSSPRRKAEALRVLGAILTRRDQHREAKQCLKQALSLSRTLGIPLLEAEVCEGISTLYRAMGNSSAADSWAQTAAGMYAAAGAAARSSRVLATHHPAVTA